MEGRNGRREGGIEEEGRSERERERVGGSEGKREEGREEGGKRERWYRSRRWVYAGNTTSVPHTLESDRKLPE